MWKGNAVVAERPDVTLDALAAEAEALAAEGTAGADELVEMIDLARQATPPIDSTTESRLRHGRPITRCRACRRCGRRRPAAPCR